MLNFKKFFKKKVSVIAFFRIVFISIIFIIVCIAGIFYCLLKPRKPNNVFVLSSWFSRMSSFFGVQIEVRYNNILDFNLLKNCIYVANHQNIYDLIMAAYVISSNTIIVGKKSLLWIPLFGQLYWLSGNFFINRNKKIYSYNALLRVVQIIKKKNFYFSISRGYSKSREKVVAI